MEQVQWLVRVRVKVRLRVRLRVRALDGTLCSMHTAKRATHTGTDARITWHAGVGVGERSHLTWHVRSQLVARDACA